MLNTVLESGTQVTFAVAADAQAVVARAAHTIDGRVVKVAFAHRKRPAAAVAVVGAAAVIVRAAAAVVGAAAAPAAPAAAPVSWACDVCTFENALDASVCDMCGTSGGPAAAAAAAVGAVGAKAAVASVPAPALPPGVWECRACTMHNAVADRVCQACMTPLA